MKHAFALTAALVFLATAPVAQTPDAASPEAERGFSLIEEGARILLEQFFKEAEPAMKDMQEGVLHRC